MLNGWRLTDAERQKFWVLGSEEGVVGQGITVVVRRNGRPMALNNSGDTVTLISPSGQTVHSKSFGTAASGKLFEWN